MDISGNVLGTTTVVDPSGNTLFSASTILDASGHHVTQYTNTGYSGDLSFPLNGVFSGTSYVYLLPGDSGNYVFDASGNTLSSIVTSINSYNQDKTVTTTLANGNDSTITTDPTGTIVLNSQITTVARDSSGNLLTTTTTNITNDASGNLQSSTLTTTDASRNTVLDETVSVDASGKVSTTKRYGGVDISGNVLGTTTVVDPSGNTLFSASTILDASGHHVTQYSDTQYVGSVFVTLNGVQGGALNIGVVPGDQGTYVLDSNGNTLSMNTTTYYGGLKTVVLTDPSGNYSSVTTDASGNVQSESITSYATDSSGNLIRTSISGYSPSLAAESVFDDLSNKVYTENLQINYNTSGNTAVNTVTDPFNTMTLAFSLSNAILYANQTLLSGTVTSDTWNVATGSSSSINGTDNWNSATTPQTVSGGMTITNGTTSTQLTAAQVNETQWTNSQGIQGIDRVVNTSGGALAGSYADTWFGSAYFGYATWNAQTGAFSASWHEANGTSSSISGTSATDPTTTFLHHPSTT